MAASLWDRMGGEAAIRPLCNDLYKMHSTDPLTAPWFSEGSCNRGKNVPGNIRKPGEIMENVFTFFSAGIGGPYEYKGNDMKKAHAHMVIPESAFHTLTNHVMVGMEKHKTGGAEEREEVLAILMSLKPDVMDGTNNAAKKESPAATKSLWDRMGGETQIRPLCNELYTMHSTDPLTASYFSQNEVNKGVNVPGNKRCPSEVAENVFTFFSAGIGGPHKYEGADMKAAHMHMKIAGPAWHALTNHVMVGMEKHKTGGPGEREEVFAILMSLKGDIMAGTEAQKRSGDTCGCMTGLASCTVQ